MGWEIICQIRRSIEAQLTNKVWQQLQPTLFKFCLVIGKQDANIHRMACSRIWIRTVYRHLNCNAAMQCSNQDLACVNIEQQNRIWSKRSYVHEFMEALLYKGDPIFKCNPNIVKSVKENTTNIHPPRWVWLWISLRRYCTLISNNSVRKCSFLTIVGFTKFIKSNSQLALSTSSTLVFESWPT